MINIGQDLTIIQNEKDLKLLRASCFVAGIFSITIASIWKYAYPELRVGLFIPSIVSVAFILLFTLTYWSNYIKQNASLFLHIAYFIGMAIQTYTTYSSHFSELNTWLLIFCVLAVILIIRRITHLIVYLLITLGIIVLLLYNVHAPGVNKSTIIAILGMFLLIGTMSVKYKIDIETAFRDSEEHYRTLVEIAPMSIIVHQDWKILYANPLAVKQAGASNLKELIGRSILDFIHPDYILHELDRIKEMASAGNSSFIELRLVMLDGSILDVEVNTISVKHQRKPALLSIYKDISERKKAEEQIRQLAYFDVLTKLPNRYSLYEQLNQSISSATIDSAQIGVMFIDLDRFKVINDTLGHSVGDLLLQQAAKRLGACFRKGDIVSRYGGDEFVIIIKDVIETEVTAIAQRVIHEFSHPFLLEGHEVYSTPSIGISFYPNDGRTVEALIKNADAAMYLSKARGRNNYQFFSTKLSQTISRKMDLETGLRKALSNQEFFLNYQPQFHLKNGRIFGVEALIRWKHPTLGLVSPAEFIPLAEETGLIIPMGEWVLETACRQNKIWQESGLPAVPIAVNVSGIQFQNPNFMKSVELALEKTGLDSKYLIIEITESVMQDTETAAFLVNELKAMGVKVALDDFGTGYSSISLLKNLNIDILKIDPSFIRDIHMNPNTIQLIKLIIDVGHLLDFDIIVEGIEDGQQAILLHQNHCNIGQGYYFSRPISCADMEKMMRLCIS